MIVKQSNQLYLSLGGKRSHPSISPQPNVANLLAFRFYTVAIRLFALRVPCEAKALPLHKRTLRVALARACIRVDCRVRWMGLIKAKSEQKQGQVAGVGIARAGSVPSAKRPKKASKGPIGLSPAELCAFLREVRLELVY